MLNIYRDEVEGNNYFSIIFKEECEKLEENFGKHEKQMSLSSAIYAKKSCNHRARGDYNAELLYSPLKIILNCTKIVKRNQQITIILKN